MGLSNLARAGGWEARREEPCDRNQQTIYSSCFKKYEEVQSLKLFEQNRYKGGVKASRNNPKCYRKQNQKERLKIKPQSARELSFSRKALSLETAYISFGISENIKNLLRIGTSGDVATVLLNIYLT